MLRWLQSSFLLAPTGNCRNSLSEAELHTEINTLVSLLITPKLQLQQAAVSPHQLATGQTPRR